MKSLKPVYYINLHPEYDYSTIIVGKGGYISKQFVQQHHDWISYAGRRQFHFQLQHINELIKYLQDHDYGQLCCILARERRYMEWEDVEKCLKGDEHCEGRAYQKSEID